MKRAITVLWAMTAVAATARPAAADQIQITAGTLQMVGSSTGSVSLEGDRGFTLEAAVTPMDSSFAPWLQCLAPCPPGTSVSLNAVFVGSSLHGATVTLDGQTFTNVGGAASQEQAALFFTGGPVVLPAADQEVVTLTAPFLLSGRFSYGDSSGGVLGVDLLGEGIAALMMQRSFLTPDGSARWRYASAVYSFADASAPIPEPATLLLTGAGLALLGRRRWARGRRVEPGL